MTSEGPRLLPRPRAIREGEVISALVFYLLVPIGLRFGALLLWGFCLWFGFLGRGLSLGLRGFGLRLVAQFLGQFRLISFTAGADQLTLSQVVKFGPAAQALVFIA